MKSRGPLYDEVHRRPSFTITKCLLWVFCAVASYPLLGVSSCQDWLANAVGWLVPPSGNGPFADGENPFVDGPGWEVDPAANPALAYPGQAFIPMLQRLSNCSLTRFVLDQNYDVLAMDPNYQDYLHQHLMPSTQGDQFKGGCSDTTTGIGSQPGAFVPLANGGGAVITISPNGVVVRVVNASGAIQSTTNFPTGTQANGSVGTALADFNGDGNLDLVVLNDETATSTTSGSVSILLGNGDGTFQNPVNIALPIAPYGLTVDDLNGDGHMDLAVVGGSSGSDSNLQVLLGKGDGTFAAPIGGPATFTTFSTNVVSADFNGDGKKDLATASGQILLGDGDGTFTLGANNIHSGQGITAADLNGDGKIDLAVADPVTMTVQTYLGKGDGTFSFSGAYASMYGVAAIRALDLDGDGNTDLFVGSSSNGIFGTGSQNALSQFQSLLGYGKGSFVGVPAYMAQASVSNRLPMYYGLGDLNGDGKPDIVYIDQNQSGPILQTLIGQGGAAFTSGPQTPVSNVSQLSLSAVVVADFNGDGKLDVAFADNGNLASGNPALQVAFGNGDGTFGPATPYTGFTTGIGTMLVADFNGDGKPDIAFVGLNQKTKDANGNATGGAYILLNQGDGTFASPQLAGLSTLPNLVSLATGDLNGDGKADLLVASGGVFNGTATGPGSVYDLLGQGNGTFAAPALVSATTSWGPVAIADMNNDGKPDILAEGAGQSGGTNLSIFPGNGDGTFGTPIVTALLDGGSDTIAVGDINVDGNLDVVSGGCCGLSYTDVLFGNGDGTFSNPMNQELLLGLSSHHLTLASLDGTKNLDLVLVATDVNTADSSIEVMPDLPVGAAASPAATSTTLTATPTPVTSGGNVSLSAIVAGASGSTGTPTGTVTFSDGSAQLGTGTLNSAGTATYSSSSLAVGSHSITAAYGGDTNFAASTSSAVTVTVAAPVPVDFSISLSPATASVSPGGTATSTMSVTPSGGFNSQVSFACSGLPLYSTCSFSPATVTPNGSAAATTTLTVATNVATASNQPNGGRRPGGETSLALLLLGLSGLASQRRKWSSLRWRTLLPALLVAVVAPAVIACGGGGGSGGGTTTNTTTPAGTSTITVTATAGSLSKTASLTLTVQ